MDSHGFLKHPEMMRELQACRQRDNVTNLFFLAATWLYLGGVFVGCLSALAACQRAGLPWYWQIPILMFGSVLVGVGQHHLGVLGHEATHFSLFRNRVMNELCSDVLCMFPLFSSTQTYRRQHLAHHRHVNDPELDPDLYQLEHSGHRFRFPMSRGRTALLFLKQLWPISQFRYTLGRMRYEKSLRKAKGTAGAEESRGRLPTVLTGLLLAGLIALLNVVGPTGDRPWLALTSTTYAVAASLVFLAIPSRLYPPQEQTCPVSRRVRAALRMATWSGMLLAIAWTAQFLGGDACLWIEFLWIAPLFTSFSYFMMVRQVLHHANADQGQLTNSRNFFVGTLVRLSVFPLGQDLHLVHHLFSSVPHYNLLPLHRALMRHEEYRAGVVNVHGIWSAPTGSGDPAAVDVLGPDYVRHDSSEPFVDYEVDMAGRT